MRSKIILFSFATSLLCTQLATAGNMGNTKDIASFSPRTAVLSFGAFNAYQGKVQNSTFLGNLTGNTYTLIQHKDQNLLLGLGYFFNKELSPTTLLSYGLNAYYLAKTQVTGSVLQEGVFENLAYQYRVSHLPLYAMIKGTFNKGKQYEFILDAGVGPNWMTTSDYSEHSLGFSTNSDFAFRGHTSTTFSATAGAGFRVDNIIGHLPLECSYRFFYLGTSKLPSNNTEIISSLSTGHGYAHALVFSVSV